MPLFKKKPKRSYLDYFVFVGLPANITERIRQLYQVREGQLKPFTWCDYPNFNLNDIFTRLKIRNREKTRGTLTDDEITNMTAIFRPHAKCQKPRIVLIEGDPGMGKTTYSRKLAYDWANKQDEWDESFPEIEVLLLLRCNDIKTSIEEAIDDQILPRDIDREAKETFFKYIKENESKVLLLLDGLDEADSCKQEMFLSLVQSKLFPACHIVITSRHEDGKEIRPYCDTLWEIVGFAKEDSKSFIRKYFQDKDHLAEKLIQDHFNDWCDNPSEYSVADLTKNPLNMTLICCLFEDSEAVFHLSRTLLYIEIVLLVLRRYEKKNGLTSNEDLILVYEKELLLLGSFAFNSLREGKFYFEIQRDMVKYINNLEFLSLQQGGTTSKPCTRCAFSHKSFQEFFACFYLAFQIIHGQIVFTDVLTDERYFKELRLVFLFMCGIMASINEETGNSLLIGMAEHISGLLRTSDQKVKSCMSLACDSLFEHYLSLRKKHWSEEKRVTCSENTFGMHLDMSSLSKVNLSATDIRDVGAAAISVVLENNSSLAYLDLSSNAIHSDGAFCLSKALTANSSLTHLNLSNNTIGDAGASSLSTALTANSSLTHLNLRNNAIGDAGASSLSTALKSNSSLTHLDLSSNWTGDAGASSLSTALRANSSLTHLNLRNNAIGDVGASSLSTALKANSSLTNLNLSGNNINDAGASSLSQALKANSSLTHLNLSLNNINDAGASSLSQAFKANSSLTNLNLSGNSGIGDAAASSLSTALNKNSSLTQLVLSYNEIGEDGACSLSKALTANVSLTNLNLSDNKIGNAGASSLFKALLANSSLTNLDLDLRYNSIGKTSKASLKEVVEKNKTVNVRL